MTECSGLSTKTNDGAREWLGETGIRRGKRSTVIEQRLVTVTEQRLVTVIEQRLALRTGANLPLVCHAGSGPNNHFSSFVPPWKQERGPAQDQMYVSLVCVSRMCLLSLAHAGQEIRPRISVAASGRGEPRGWLDKTDRIIPRQHGKQVASKQTDICVL
jgi:hypothetical protein